VTKLLDVARDAVARALKHGAGEAVSSAHRTREVELGWRDGKVEKTSEATTRGLSLALYVDGRYAAVSTSDLRPEALDAFVAEAVAMARTLAKDSFRSLPDPSLYAGRADVDLRIFDPGHEAVTPDVRRRLAKEMEDAARSVKGAEQIVTVTTTVSDSRSERARFASNGFEGEIDQTAFWLNADVSVRDPDGRRPEEWWVAGARAFSALPPAADVGRLAAERALGSIGAKKTESAVLPLVVENRAAGRLVSSLFAALYGRALQQKQSWLEGKLGTAIANKILSIADDPLLPGGFGSRLWDNDGIAARRRPMIEAGVLRAYYVDDYYGRKLGLSPTSGTASNIVVAPGTKDLAALLADVKEGVLVTGFLGGNSNTTTGDYSFGIQGYRIRGGKRAEPVSETNIAGNHKELWKKLAAVGGDPWPYSSMRSPSLVFEGVQVAGS
jgi:PmbA protein